MSPPQGEPVRPIPPRIFISATSAELRSVRQLVKEALLTLGCLPVEQTNFHLDSRTVSAMLEARIADCHALIHIAGMRFGAAAPAAAPGADGTSEPRSFSQLEYDIGRRLQRERGEEAFKVYTFICSEDFPYDQGGDPEDDTLRALQLAHRERLARDPHLWEPVATPAEVERRILSMPPPVVTHAPAAVPPSKPASIPAPASPPAQDGLLRIAGGALLLGAIGAAAWVGWGGGADSAGGGGNPVGRMSVVAVMGENVEYERQILAGFMDTLEAGLRARNVALVQKTIDPRFQLGTYASPHEPEGKDVWEQLISGFEFEYTNQNVDYFVTLGTYATLAVKEAGLVGKHQAKGLIYLGVTDPQAAGFVGNPRTAGVQYGTGGRDYGRMIDRLFNPEQRLAFLYNEGVVQDEFFAEKLTALNEELRADPTPGRRATRFDLVKRPHAEPIDIGDITPPDPADPNESPVYFAWYGLDNILQKPALFARIAGDHLWVVPSTYSAVNLRAAGVIVSVNDYEVGQMGAEIILKKADQPTLDLAAEPVRAPAFVAWICRPTIETNHLQQTIRKEVFAAAQAGTSPDIVVQDAPCVVESKRKADTDPPAAAPQP